MRDHPTLGGNDADQEWGRVLETGLGQLEHGEHFYIANVSVLQLLLDMDCNTDRKRVDICKRVAHHLEEAGFSPAAGAPSGGLAMRRVAVDSTLALGYDPAAGLLRLSVSFARGAAKCGIFRGGRGELRIFAGPSSLLGLLCWITSSHDDLSAFEADAWLAQIVSLCPATYAVLASPSGEEVLALVMPQEVSATLQ